MNDYIIISDDEEEVQILDHVINLDREPIIIDLTTPNPKKRYYDDISPPDESSRSPNTTPPPPPPPPDEPPRTPPRPPNEPLRPKPQPRSQPRPESQPRPQTHFHPQPQPQQKPQQKPPQQKPHQQPPQQPHPPQQPQPPQQPRPTPQPPREEPPTPARSPPVQSLRPHQSDNQNQHRSRPRPSTPLAQPPPPQKRPLTDEELMISKKELGNKKFRCNQLNDAIVNYRQAIELAKKLDNKEMSAILHFNLAMSYDKLGSYEQAADECAAAVRLNENYIKAHVKRAEIYMSQGKFEEAVIVYEHICELDSTKKDDAMRRINHARQMAKTQRRKDQYEILELRPNFLLEDLRAAYKRMARKHHPDKHSDADLVTKRIQEKLFKEASEAYSFFRKRFGA